jgi:hypothetical protein
MYAKPRGVLERSEKCCMEIYKFLNRYKDDTCFDGIVINFGDVANRTLAYRVRRVVSLITMS